MPRLYPYQQEGVSFLVTNAINGRGSLLADSMGLGKTCQTIAALARLWKIDRAKYFPCVILAPNSVLYNWKAEFDRFGFPSEKYDVVHASNKNQKWNPFDLHVCK